MNKAHGNEMTVYHFHDFYYLEAMMAGITMAKSANPELEYKHSLNRLERDIEAEYTRLTKSIALRVYVYLWAAALGEARHARNRCDVSVKELSGTSRGTVFANALQFFPDEKNVNLILDIFGDRGWGGAYGGKKWYEIVTGMSLYGKISDSAFIDHAVDLEHNGGCVFDKFSGRDTLQFSCDGYSTLHGFLDYKFKHDILNDEWIDNWDNKQTIEVSKKIFGLVFRYQNVIGGKATEWLKPELETLSDYSVDWDVQHLSQCGRPCYASYAKHKSNGKEEARRHRLETRERERRERRDYFRCENCNCRMDDYETYTGADDCLYCESCYYDMFESCEYCGTVMHNDDAVLVQNEGYYCEHCATHKKNAVKCWNCDEWHAIDSGDITICEDSGDWYCNDCIEGATAWECPECGAHHEYFETLKCENCGHPQNEEEERETFQNWEDGDGVLDNTNTLNFLESEVATFEIRLHGGKQEVTATIYRITESPLFVYDISETEKQIYNTVPSNYAIWTPSGYWINPHTTDLIEAMHKANVIKGLADWNTIANGNQLTHETRDLIKRIMGY